MVAAQPFLTALPPMAAKDPLRRGLRASPCQRCRTPCGKWKRINTLIFRLTVSAVAQFLHERSPPSTVLVPATGSRSGAN